MQQKPMQTHSIFHWENSIFELFWFVGPFACFGRIQSQHRKHYFQCINKNEFIAKSKLSLDNSTNGIQNGKKKLRAHNIKNINNNNSKIEFNNARFIPNAFSCQFMCFCVARKMPRRTNIYYFQFAMKCKFIIRQK